MRLEEFRVFALFVWPLGLCTSPTQCLEGLHPALHHLAIPYVFLWGSVASASLSNLKH